MAWSRWIVLGSVVGMAAVGAAGRNADGAEPANRAQPAQQAQQSLPALPEKLAQVAAASAEPVELGKESGWSKIPAYLVGAKIFAQSPTGRELDVTVKSDGFLVIAASWTYDGNRSGGWARSARKREMVSSCESMNRIGKTVLPIGAFYYANWSGKPCS